MIFPNVLVLRGYDALALTGRRWGVLYCAAISGSCGNRLYETLAQVGDPEMASCDLAKVLPSWRAEMGSEECSTDAKASIEIVSAHILALDEQSESGFEALQRR